MPRSQNTTLSLPPAMMYSAALSHSLMVAERPRFKSTGVCTLPTSLSSWKFCMLRAPIWIMSAYFVMSSTSLMFTISVTTLSPVLSAASRSIFSPSSASPWKS